jgi:hypothetical protein
MPQVELSNAERTVTFQVMMHVGSESFYKSVVYDLERAKSDGYTMYFEGVQPGTPESDEWFSNTLAGGGDLSASYDALARTCGLEFQLDYFEFLRPEMEAEPDRFVNADVTTADMQAEAERLAEADPGFGEALDEIAEMVTGSGTEAALDGFVRVQNEGSEGQKEIAGIVCRGVMSLLHGGGATADGTGTALDPVILDFRNRALAERILGTTDEKIFVTYGAGHLPGVIDLLKEADPAGEVESVKWVRAIAPPDDYDVELSGDADDADK